MRTEKSLLCFLAITIGLLCGTIHLSLAHEISHHQQKTGSLKGRIIDEQVKSPIAEVIIKILGTSLIATTDEEGNFTITDVPVGSYSLEAAYPAYKTRIMTDVIVKSSRITFIEIELRPDILFHEHQEITVTAGYFTGTEQQPTSTTNFSNEEIRRAAGSGGDVSRIISGLPSIARVNDTTNSLVVRGGNPAENAFYIDNIEIPNINHYPTQGSTGGPIGLLNVDFIKDVHFYSGGFSPIYGDRLSSVMDITFRSGNRDEHDIQLDMNMAGFGLVAEGPLGRGNSSWLLSARKSYLDLLVDAIGTGVAPNYGDLQGKLNFELSSKNRISVLGLLGMDEIGWDKEDSVDSGDPFYGDFTSTEGTLGINWFCMWGNNGYSNTSISQSYTKYTDSFFDANTDELSAEDKNHERTWSLRNVNHYKINDSHKFRFGLEAKHLINQFDYFYDEYTDVMGNLIPEVRKDIKESAQQYAAFINYTWNPVIKLTLNIGVRTEYFSYNKNFHFSPRLSLSYQLSRKTALNGAAGIFYQHLPLSLLVQEKYYRNLKDPVAYHFVVGINHLLTANTRLSLEVYNKEYNSFPLDPAQPGLFVVDEIFYSGYFGNHRQLIDNGRARSYGIEIMIQKKLAEKIYGVISGAYFRTRYKDFFGEWRNRIYDNRYIFSIEGGYKLSRSWEISVKWNYAGGAPYTPFDLEVSQHLNSGVFDTGRINGARLPAYHSLNIRCDKRFHFSGSNLTLIFSFWNIYNRKNIAFYYWNTIENKPDRYNQWSLLPIVGLEFEF